MKLNTGSITFCFLLISTIAYSQNNAAFLTKADAALKKQTAGHPVEKVYLHLDKPHYAPGDTIWFKAYTVIGEHHRLSALSGVLYVELINPKDSVVKRLTLPLTAGVAWGDFSLLRSYKPGGYHIRAYTNWMRNAGAEYFFNQRVQVGAPQLSLTDVKQSESPNPDVQFFPEGGTLVNGVRSRIAIKAVGSNGLGVDITGTIEDNQGNVVADLTTQHLGMGIFALIPQSGKTYRAKIKGTGESAFTVDLPPAVDEGVTLALNNSRPDSVFIRVAVNEATLEKQKNNAFYIVGQSGGKVYYTAQGNLEGMFYSAKVDKCRFPSGIAQFTLFSQSGEPLAERVAFIQSNDTLKLNLAASAGNYTTRRPVKIAIEATDNKNSAVTGSFSVAVINESRVGTDEDAESTILSNLLLTSDLKGYIEQPNYYFNTANEQSKADLDVLMLTQGYRRFEWKHVLNDTNQTIAYLPERSLELSGALKTPSGKPVPNGKVTLVATKQNILRDTTTDINGNFKFTDLYLPDTAKLVLRARKEHNGSNVAIYVQQRDYPPVIKQKQTVLTASLTSGSAASLPANSAGYHQQKEDSSASAGGRVGTDTTMLKQVTIKGRKIAKPDIYNNYGAVAEYDVDMAKLSADYFRIEDALTLLIPGFTGFNHRYTYEMKPISVIIDGLPRKIADLDFFLPNEIESIRMVSGTGTQRPELILTTKRYAGTDTASTIKLKQVTIQAKKINKAPDLSNSDNLNGAGNADQVIMGDKLEGCITLSDCLNGKVFGVTFDQNGIPHSIRAQGRLSGSPAMVIIVDGNVMDGSHLNELNANDISSIEVLRSGGYLAVYGSNAPGGALVITTKRGGGNDYVTSETPSGLITYPFSGFYKARTFYSPKFSGPKTNAQNADLRNTIYWNPNIITDKDGKASFGYFNNDTKGVYRVVIEGIDTDGNLGRTVYRYKVE